MKIDRITLAPAKKYTDEHGGGGGTSNYNSLTNKPKINNVELSGNKTLEQLGVPLDTSDLTNGAGFITENDIPAIPEKTSDLTNDSGFITSSDLPTKVSDLTNDAGYITKSVDDLTNYTTTSGMNTALSGKVSNSSVGTAGGVAELDNTGKVPSSQLPSYVDDVIDGYYNETDGKFYEESIYTTEITGEAGKIYISVDTDLQYRWTGTAFSALGGALVLGETSSTAYRGDRGKAAYDISQTVGDVSDLDTTDKSSVINAINEVHGMRVPCGFTPIGTVISYMGTTAPQNYLACDDTAYNIADYPELAAFFEAQFGSKNYFGGDGTTTFKCPDLRGEFLRGTGTNGHSGEGDGANVGGHQSATTIPNIEYEYVSNEGRISLSRGASSSVPVSNKDKETGASDAKKCYAKGTFDTMGTSGNSSYTTRPTNTSVLYCIAYKDIYVDARFDYSLTEKVVGTWIDGKPLYQKTFTGTSPSTPGTSISTGLTNVDYCFVKEGVIENSLTYVANVTFVNNNTSGNVIHAVSLSAKKDGSEIFFSYNQKGTLYFASQPYVITLCYTKTTD